MITFKDWILQKESSASTRARAAAARGLMPLATVGSVNGHSSAPPWELEQITKAMKKRKSKKKRFGAVSNKKKIAPVNRNLAVDDYVKEVGELKDALTKLKAIFDDKAKKVKEKPKKPQTKPVPEKKEKPQDSEQKDGKDTSKEDDSKEVKKVDKKMGKKSEE